MTDKTKKSSCGCARLFSNPSRAFFRLPAVGAALVLIAAMTLPVFAAPINYPGHVGDTVEYYDVSEDANSFGDSPPLFGAPVYSGDSIDFNPVGFSAQSAGGGADITDGNLRFRVKALDGFAINNISFYESGDTTLAGVGTPNTSTYVTASGTINVYAVDGVGINVLASQFALTFTPSGGTFQLGVDGGPPFYQTQWTGSGLIDIDAILVANNVPFNGGATQISIDLDNTLTAISELNTQSMIAKKDFGGLSITINIPPVGDIPEPTSLGLAGIALLGLVAGRRWGR